MSSPSSNLRGIVFMVLSTGSFLVNDTILKLVLADIPPFETLFIRGIMATLWGLPLLALTGELRQVPAVLDRRVLFRNLFELIAVVGYILAIAHAPLADITALSQLAPMVLMIGAVVFLGEKIGLWQVGLVLIAFIGAIMVAQPGGAGFTPYALFGLWNAVCIAGRDLAGRRVAAEVPGIVVAMGAGLIVVVGAGLISFTLEAWVTPTPVQWLMLAGSGLFLMFGHMLIFLAYRVAATGVVLPFSYSGTVWALILGVAVFGVLPNPLALFGIGMILLSGVLVVLLTRNEPPVTSPT